MFVLFFLIAIYISGSLRNYDHLLLMKVLTVNKQKYSMPFCLISEIIHPRRR